MRNISHITLKGRLSAAMLLIALLFCALTGRLFWLQAVEGESLTDKAFGQWTRGLPMRAERGEIVTSDGVTLASSYDVFTVYVRPVETEDAKETARAIAETCDAEYERILARIDREGVSEVRALTGANEAQALALRARKIDGVYVVADSARYYDNGNFATQLLGFVNADGVGQSGIELYYDSYLKGVDGEAYTETDLIGGKLDGSHTSYLMPIEGATLTLTIDFTLQSLAEKAVRDAVEKYSPLSASCLMLDADTGEILALAGAPTYDPNDLPRDDLALLLQGAKNTSVADVYEPGSTFGDGDRRGSDTRFLLLSRLSRRRRHADTLLAEHRPRQSRFCARHHEFVQLRVYGHRAERRRGEDLRLSRKIRNRRAHRGRPAGRGSRDIACRRVGQVG